MKVSENLSRIKQKEGQLMRLYSFRDAIAKQTFKDAVQTREKDTTKLVEEKRAQFHKDKAKKFSDLTGEIEKLTQELIETKHKINRINVENGIDAKLAEMKYLRLELSKLMALINKESYYENSIQIDMWEKLGIADRIKSLELRKAKLDAHIQSTNWSIEA